MRTRRSLEAQKEHFADILASGTPQHAAAGAPKAHRSAPCRGFLRSKRAWPVSRPCYGSFGAGNRNARRVREFSA